MASCAYLSHDEMRGYSAQALTSPFLFAVTVVGHRKTSVLAPEDSLSPLLLLCGKDITHSEGMRDSGNEVGKVIHDWSNAHCL